MNILQINKFFYRRRGAETYLFDLSELLRSKGHNVAEFAMVHPDNEPSPWSEYFVSEVDYSQKTLAGNIKAAARMFWSTEAQRKLDALLDVFKPDVAHIHNIYHQISPSILVTLKKRGIPIVLTLHDYKLICPNYEMFTGNQVCMRCKGRKYYNAVLHKCIKGSVGMSALVMFEMYLHKMMQVYEHEVDCFISPSQFLKKQMLDWGEQVKRIEVIPNFVRAPITDGVMDGSDASRVNDVLYAGALSRIKGVDLILDNFRKNRYSGRLLLAGSGPMEAEIKAESNENIVYLGQLSKQELANRVKECRAVIVPSRYHDNFPYAVLEAFAAGKPVIASHRGGMPELVQPRHTGWLFEPTKPDSLTAALTEMFKRDDLVKQFGEAACQVAKTHNPEKHYETIISLYQSLLS
ncbi:MAG: glycosyltransferase [Patescibacteria group bacterium]